MRPGSSAEVRNLQRNLRCCFMKTRFFKMHFFCIFVQNIICRSPLMEIRILNSPLSKDPLACLVNFTQRKHQDIPPDTCNKWSEIEHELSWHFPPVFRNYYEWRCRRWKFWKYNCHPPWQSLSQVSIPVLHVMIHQHNPILNIRLGRASDVTPSKVLHCIAR